MSKIYGTCPECFHTTKGLERDDWGTPYFSWWCAHCDEFTGETPTVGSGRLLYVNAYGVTRRYGGSEEGGWWYNHREPLASIPIAGVVVVRDDGSDGITVRAKTAWQAVAMVAHLRDLYNEIKHGNIYSVLGGEDLEIDLEPNPGEATKRPRYE